LKRETIVLDAPIPHVKIVPDGKDYSLRLCRVRTLAKPPEALSSIMQVQIGGAQPP
jgi:hypothetical protein